MRRLTKVKLGVIVGEARLHIRIRFSLSSTCLGSGCERDPPPAPVLVSGRMHCQKAQHTRRLALHLSQARQWTMVDNPIRILTVEDHPVFREGLTRIIGSEPDMRLVGQAANAAEAIAEFRRHRPDITLMDLRLPGTNGTDTLISIRGEYPDARIIMLTTSDGDGDIQRAMRAGAWGYILKSMPQEELLDVVRSVHAGRRHVPAEVAARLAEHWGEEDLTTRELEVLRLIRDGYRNKQIADQLVIAETTVSFHIKNLVNKLGANDRTHAVTIALRRGLLNI